ncbi:MAG TPA: hypothetical protein VL486_07905 [Verrucomicrobiae bacterium]|nr:hypothetical protein [Verrucomicrobiae bacterium]
MKKLPPKVQTAPFSTIMVLLYDPTVPYRLPMVECPCEIVARAPLSRMNVLLLEPPSLELPIRKELPMVIEAEFDTTREFPELSGEPTLS